MANTYRPKSSEGRFRPRDLRGDTELGRLLILLELPDCGCPFARIEPCPLRACGARIKGGRCECPPMYPFEPCEHVLAAARRWPEGMTDERWAGLLRSFDARGLDGPPLPDRPAATLSRPVLLAVWISRAASGRHYRHPGDLVCAASEKVLAERLAVLVGPDRVRDKERLPKKLSLAELYQRPDAKPADVLRAWRDERGLLPALRAAARGCGYALAANGDLAGRGWLSATPWDGRAAKAPVLVEAIRAALGGRIEREGTAGWVSWSIRPGAGAAVALRVNLLRRTA